MEFLALDLVNKNKVYGAVLVFRNLALEACKSLKP